ncbi:MAG: alpha/beta hydrolase [Cellulomonadaceae bacterium]|jgi:alpha-beta hydrolase superfamily lysophospholipase|nr:alpha/beta hydrolase [Cellulomonadaceae bacterium]
MIIVTESLNWKPDPLGVSFEQAELTTIDDAKISLVRYVGDAAGGGEASDDGEHDGGGAARGGGSFGAGGGTPGGDRSGSGGEPRGRVRPAVLYVHGFSDYFFHPHLAQAFAAAGYPFFAVDLRGYGRSMAAHTVVGGNPNMVPEIAVHGRDLDTAVGAIRALGHNEVVVLGHSMGGLVASMWAASRPSAAAALVLNSPWFDLNESWLLRGPGSAAIQAISLFAPKAVVGGLKPHYGQALHHSNGGQWDYDLTWKPHAGFPVQAAWISSIRRAQARLKAGLGISIPILVLSSTRSGPSKVWHPRLTATDSVLNVEHIAAGAAHLGSDVTFVQIAEGAHDLALSATPQAREDYVAAVLGWLEARIH